MSLLDIALPPGDSRGEEGVNEERLVPMAIWFPDGEVAGDLWTWDILTCDDG